MTSYKSAHHHRIVNVASQRAPQRPCACCQTRHQPKLYTAQEALAGCGEHQPLTAAEIALFGVTARWLDELISRPNPALGRAGDVCPWTRRTLQLGRLFLASIPAREESCIDVSVLWLLEEFKALARADGALDPFRAIVAVFPLLPSESADACIVSAHARLKPSFLRHGLMLGEFYPSCEKPGLRAADFRPLRAPHALLVIRVMVEADLLFLTDRDEFLDAYLAVFGARGRSQLQQLVEQEPERIPPGREHALRARLV